MTRHALALPLLLAVAAPVRADAQAAAQAPTAPRIVVEIAAPSMLSGHPTAWRDSIIGAWERRLTDERMRAVPHLIPGSFGEVSLQLMRNGDLRRARIRTSTGDPAFDTLLLQVSHETDQALAYPPFPPGMEGAGTEVILAVRVPLPMDGGRVVLSDSDSTQYSTGTAACDTVLREPNTYSAAMLWGWVDSAQGGTAVVEWARRALTSVQSEFVSPGRVRPRYIVKVIRDPHVLETPAPDRGWVRLRVDATGRLHGVELVNSTGYPPVDSALMEMFRRADSSGLIPPPPTADSTTVDIALEARRIAPRGSVPIGRLELGEWMVDHPPQIRRAGNVRYPPRLRSAGIGGRVNMQFTVGRDGRPIRSSLQIISSPHPELSQAGAEMALSTEYRPGSIRGCVVPVTVRQGVNFNP